MNIQELRLVIVGSESWGSTGRVHQQNAPLHPKVTSPQFWMFNGACRRDVAEGELRQLQHMSHSNLCKLVELEQAQTQLIQSGGAQVGIQC